MSSPPTNYARDFSFVPPILVHNLGEELGETRQPCRSCGMMTIGTLTAEFVIEPEQPRRTVTVPLCFDCTSRGLDGERVDIRFEESETEVADAR